MTAKLPSSMQMAAMYGVKLDVYTNLRGSDDNMSLTGRATGATGKDPEKKDVYKGNADLAFRMPHSALGSAGGSEGGPLTLTGGPELDIGFFEKTLFEGVKDYITEDVIEQISDLTAAKQPVADAGMSWTTLSIIGGLAPGLHRTLLNKKISDISEASEVIEKAKAYQGRLPSPAAFPLAEGETPSNPRFAHSKNKAFNTFIASLKQSVGVEKEGGGKISDKDVKDILNLYLDRYDDNWRLKSNFRESMRHLLMYMEIQELILYLY